MTELHYCLWAVQTTPISAPPFAQMPMITASAHLAAAAANTWPRGINVFSCNVVTSHLQIKMFYVELDRYLGKIFYLLTPPSGSGQHMLSVLADSQARQTDMTNSQFLAPYHIYTSTQCNPLCKENP